MPLMPPGNRLFRAYFDANTKLQQKFIGPDPITCRTCGRTTYRTASRRCPWASLCVKQERADG